MSYEDFSSLSVALTKPLSYRNLFELLELQSNRTREMERNSFLFFCTLMLIISSLLPSRLLHLISSLSSWHSLLPCPFASFSSSLPSDGEGWWLVSFFEDEKLMHHEPRREREWDIEECCHTNIYASLVRFHPTSHSSPFSSIASFVDHIKVQVEQPTDRTEEMRWVRKVSPLGVFANVSGNVFDLCERENESRKELHIRFRQEMMGRDEKVVLSLFSLREWEGWCTQPLKIQILCHSPFERKEWSAYRAFSLLFVNISHHHPFCWWKTNGE